MKNILATVFCSLVCLGLFAQDFFTEKPTQFGKWKMSQMTWSVGPTWSEYKSMSLDNLMTFAENPAEVQRDLQNMEEEASTMTAGLTSFSAISFSPRDFTTGDVNTNQQIVIGVTANSAQESMVSYKNEAMDTSIVFCNAHSEIALDGSYQFNATLGKRLYVYGGAGANTGLTYGNQMIVMQGEYFEKDAHPSSQESLMENRVAYRAKPVTYYRLYIPYGVHIKFTESFSIGVDLRRGIGWQKIQGEQSNFINNTGSFMIGARVRLS